MPRFFRRLSEGVFDLDDLRQRTTELADFVHEAERPLQLRSFPRDRRGFFERREHRGESLFCLQPGTLASRRAVSRDGADRAGSAAVASADARAHFQRPRRSARPGRRNRSARRAADVRPAHTWPSCGSRAAISSSTTTSRRLTTGCCKPEITSQIRAVETSVLPFAPRNARRTMRIWSW